MAEKQTKHNSWTKMTAEELAEATKRFDQEIDLENDTRPMTPKERALFERWRQGSSAESAESNNEDEN